MDVKTEFKKKFIDVCLINENPMTSELLKLFDQLLIEEFNDNPAQMDKFIQSIIDEYAPPEPDELEQLKQENEKLKNRVEEMATQQALTDGAIMDLASMVLTK